MKIILSRKGFDFSWGGYQSPILPDNRLVSLPIPSEDGIKYSEINVSDIGPYYHIMRQLYPKKSNNPQIRNNKWVCLTEDTQCHLDPDLIRSAYRRDSGWMPLFGQIDIAQSHLSNNNVGPGDLFLFFGLFQKTIYKEKIIVFDESEPSTHIIFGYFQIEKIHPIDESNHLKLPSWMQYHPHLKPHNIRNNTNNTIYESKLKLSFNPKLPGAGVFDYDESLVLTKKGRSVSQWMLPEIFRGVTITYHSNKYGWKEDYFQSAFRGQEFIVEDDDKISEWAKNLIEKNTIKDQPIQ